MVNDLGAWLKIVRARIAREWLSISLTQKSWERHWHRSTCVHFPLMWSVYMHVHVDGNVQPLIFLLK
jgi:hypothetical protein